VKGIEAKLRAGFSEKADRLEAQLVAEKARSSKLLQQLQESDKALQATRAELESTKKMLQDSVDNLTAQLMKTKEDLTAALLREDDLGERLADSEKILAEKTAELESAMDTLQKKLADEHTQRKQRDAELEFLRLQLRKTAQEMVQGLGSSFATGNLHPSSSKAGLDSKVLVPSVTCHVSAGAVIKTAQLPPQFGGVANMYRVTLPVKTALELPAMCSGIKALPSGGQSVAERMPKAARDNASGEITIDLPSGALLTIPSVQENMDDDLEGNDFQDVCYKTQVPVGSIITIPIGTVLGGDMQERQLEMAAPAATQEEEGSAALPLTGGKMEVTPRQSEARNGREESESFSMQGPSFTYTTVGQGSGLAAALNLIGVRYRCRTVKLPAGSLVLLPYDTHRGVKRYSIRAEATCQVHVDEEEVMAKSMLIEEASEQKGKDRSTVVSALVLGARFSENPDHNGTIKLDLQPGTVLVTSGSGLSTLWIPEGSIIVAGPGVQSAMQGDLVKQDHVNSSPRVAQLEEELARLKAALFPLELLRMRLKHLLFRNRNCSHPGTCGANAAAMSVLVELAKEEPRRVSGQALVMDDEFLAPRGGLVFIAETYYSVKESDGAVTITLKRSGGAKGKAGVIVNTVNGRALADSDFEGVADLQVVWQDGDDSDRHVVIKLIDDDFHERDESFFFVISDIAPDCDSRFSIGKNDACEILIIDDDPEPLGSEVKKVEWDAVKIGSELPWEAKDVPRQLTVPERLQDPVWKAAIETDNPRNMKKARAKILMKNFITAKRASDLVEDRRGTPRPECQNFFRFFMEYTFGADHGPAKTAALLSTARYFYRINTEPFVSMCVCLIGFYDAAPPRISDVFGKVCSLLASGLLSCDHAPFKFWNRLDGSLKMSQKEIKHVFDELFNINAAGSKLFQLESKSKDLSAFMKALPAHADVPDAHVLPEDLSSLGPLEVPVVPVVQFLMCLIQFTNAKIASKREALFELVKQHAKENDGGVAMLPWDGYKEVFMEIDKSAGEKRMIYYFKRVLKENAAAKEATASFRRITQAKLEKSQVPAERIAEVLYNNLDFVFGSSWT